MTRKEKEKLVLDALGLKVGDVVEIKYSEDKATDKRIIVENDYCYYCSSIKHPELLKAISVLLCNDFEKIVAKKKKGELKCTGVTMTNGCKNCPLKTLYRCGCSSKTETVNDCLESIKEYLDPRVYDTYKTILDDKVEDE